MEHKIMLNGQIHSFNIESRPDHFIGKIDFPFVDCSGRCSTPAGKAGKLRPHRAKPEEAQLTPRGKGASEAEINQHSLIISS